MLVRLVFWLAGLVSVILTATKLWVDFVGRSTYQSDYDDLDKLMKAIMDFIAEQPGILVYGSFVVVVGLLIYQIILILEQRRARARAPASRETFTADLHPKELFRYLCKDAVWASKFQGDKQAWFNATQIALRDQLRQGRRMHSQGRPPGKHGDGTFRHPADFIERDFWANGDLNWIRVLNADYSGDIDAYDHGYQSGTAKSFDDVLFCRREVEAIWPKRNRIAIWLLPNAIEPFEKPNYGPPPWQNTEASPTQHPSPQISGGNHAAKVILEHESYSEIRIGEHWITVSPSSKTNFWFYGGLYRGVHKLNVDRGTSPGSTIDISKLRVERDSVAVSIGERAIYTMADGEILQILVVDVLCFQTGDDRDEIQVRYSVHPKGEHLIKAL